MNAYRINRCIIAADFVDEAEGCFLAEIGEPITTCEEISLHTEISTGDGAITTVKALINNELDRRNEWLRMGVPCELHWPFVVVKTRT